MIWENFLNSQAVENLGWTLLHSVWQIALIAAWLFLALRVFARSSAGARYALSLAALILSFLVPFLTFVQLSQNPPPASKDFAAKKEKSATRLENPNYPAQDFPAEKNAETTDAAPETFLISVESLRNSFAAKVSGFSPVLVGFWFVGILFFALRLAVGARQLHIYKTRRNLRAAKEWEEKFSVLCEKFKIKQTVRLLQSNAVNTPMVIGWLKPVILIPAGVFLQLTPKELETIVAHELVHIRRFDFPVNWAQSFVEILFFYHPAVWWISAEIRRERECACDETVTRVLENSRFVYANALANLEELRLKAKTNTIPPATAANGGNLMKRIERIIKYKNAETNRANSLWTASLALLLISAVLTTVFSLNSGFDVNAQNNARTKKLAIGFVSIPPNDRMGNPPKDSEATARLLIEKLAQYKIPAIGFVQGGMISDGEKFYPQRADIVRLWRDAGLEIGIGGFKHIWFYHTPYEDFLANAEKNERVTRQILAEKNLPLRFFSYPFLNTGKNAEERNRFEARLDERGIKAVKYTIDNQEWMYSFAYDAARKENDLSRMTKIRAEFVKYMSEMFDHYEAYSREMFGRDINQTLVLTPSRLVADAADELFAMIEKRGYRFVPMDEALADEAFQTEENFYGKAGISWFERWQLARGKKLRDEPQVNRSIEEAWENEKIKNVPAPPAPPAPPTPPAPTRPPKKSA